MVVNLWQEEDPSEFIQRHYQPHNNREKCCWKTFLQYTIPWTGKLVSGGNKGQEMLSLANTTFSSRENHGDNHLYCPMGKAFSTSKPCNPVCLARKKQILQSYDQNLWMALGNLVGHRSEPYSVSAWHFISTVDDRGGTAEECYSLETVKLETADTQWHTPDSSLRHLSWPCHTVCPWMQWLCFLISQHAWIRIPRAL